MDLDLLKWMVEHGSTGVLAVAAVAEGLVIQSMWKQINAVQEARIKDLEAYTEKLESSREKIHKTADDLGRAADIMLKRSVR